ncbi:DUF1801 domain-containing protein [uncultured Methylibium sp.]|uniref:DUF1801 domain-containing protein n=1 Tax=uncultured Methylibium sp. TaxID=381093 RepID=UPI0025CC210F|nr:DUF1801 domain-containing protein [uncultured Methylibium sp.]
MAEAKTRPTGASVAGFIAGVGDAQRRADCQEVARRMRAATGAEAEMWGSSIVGFGRTLLTYADGRRSDWPIVGFSPRKNDLTLYLMAGFEDHAALMARLGRHKTGRSCLYLKRLSDVDLDVLQALIEASVAAMAGQRVPSDNVDRP